VVEPPRQAARFAAKLAILYDGDGRRRLDRTAALAHDPPAMRALLGAVLVLTCGACASWKPVHSSGEWTLYVKDGEKVDIERFDRALAPAFAAVEERMGTFEERVRVHAWEDAANLDRSHAVDETDEELQIVPGIGPARVRAFHVRSSPFWFESSGVFLGTAEVGTAVHELVHARLAEEHEQLPLWFEEGLASLYGDGAMVDERWVVDGLACWQLRELRDQQIDDAELAHLLGLTARDEYDARENLLVHFIGWAIVFDTRRELPDGDWRAWLAAFERGAAEQGAVAEARERLTRALDVASLRAWLERLRDEDPAVRFATAKGLWKLRNVEVIDRMLDALDREADPQVRAALALNLLLATSETRLGRTRWNRFAGLVFPTLRDAELPVAAEQAAVRDLHQWLRRWGSRRERATQDALDRLARFWEE
jgi:hypothetical protein